jgi:outer membrane protein OmpA-like peptidoglycan-associated protein/curli biogenesis system outer membrane secretion channel CsgG
LRLGWVATLQGVCMFRSLRRLVVLVLVAGCAGTKPAAPPPPPEAPARAYPDYAGPRLRVSIAGFADEEPNKPQLEALGFKDLAPLLEEQIITELVRTNRVTVLERKQLKKVAGEIDLGYGDMAQYFAKSEKVEKGKFLMAQAMFTGAITEFEPDAEGFSAGVTVASIGAKASAKVARVGIEVRLVDVQSGAVLESTHAEGTASRIEGEAGISYLGIKIGGGGYYKTPLGRATREALGKGIDFILDKIGAIPWEARLVSAEGPERVFVRGGADINLKPGDTFDVVVRANELLDPISGNSLGFAEAIFGRLAITEVQPEISIGRMVDGRVPPLSAVIRSPGQGPSGIGAKLMATTGEARSASTVAPSTAAAGTAAPSTVAPAGAVAAAGGAGGAPGAGGAAAPGGKAAGPLEVPTYYDVPPLAQATDADANGIPKALYACSKPSAGCSDGGKPAALVGSDRLVLARPVEFDLGKATLTGAAFNMLDQVAYLLAAKPQIGKLRIEGHTDNTGDANHNLRLSQARAKAVRNYLAARGVAEERLGAQGLGDQKPLADNKTEAGRQKNRRVEFVFEH